MGYTEAGLSRHIHCIGCRVLIRDWHAVDDPAELRCPKGEAGQVYELRRLFRL